MGKVIVKATGSCMSVDKTGDTRIRISDTEALSLYGLAKTIEGLENMISEIYLIVKQIGGK